MNICPLVRTFDNSLKILKDFTNFQLVKDSLFDIILGNNQDSWPHNQPSHCQINEVEDVTPNPVLDVGVLE